MKILLVEDDSRTAQFIIKGLKQAGYVVEHFSDGKSALSAVLCSNYDVAVIDVMLPIIDGLTLISRMREEKIMIPVIILSAKGTVDDRIRGLEKGSDDYLVKPFSFSELLARISALIRRAGAIPDPTALRTGPLEMDLLKRKVFRDKIEIDIQPLEYALLEYLMRHQGRVVSKTMIMENVWEYNFDPQTNVVEARICKLRDKIDRPFKTKLIHTVRGFGYVFEARV